VLTHDRPIVIVAEPGREMEAAVRLGRIGFDNVVGYLKDGVRSLESRPELTATTDRLSPAVAAERLAAARPGRTRPTLIDVRAPRERDEKHVAGSISLPLSQLVARANELPKGQPVIVYCAGGYRSSIAASVLESLGFTDVSEVAGGIAAWETAVLQSAELRSTLVHR